MGHKHLFECLNRSLRDIMGSVDSDFEKIMFGGKVVLLGGGFKQILPVIQHGSRNDIIRACLKKSFLWKDIKKLKLTINMRISNWSILSEEDSEFAALLYS